MDDWEGSFSEPFRERSNTWPRSVPLNLERSPPPAVPDIIEEASEVECAKTPPASKPKPRRNVWGNKSYAELITEAILSTNEKRLTLSQIYEWMVKNVDHFRDKLADNSSAGWKNSIRHNLSLHHSFMKTPNEQAGKSSWWVLNPNAKSNKAPRRRISAHRNPIMELDHTEEPFRRRTKSDCSIYGRPSSPLSNIYAPNGISNISELEKQEADKFLDSLVEALKLEASANQNLNAFQHIDTNLSPSCSTGISSHETNVLVSSLQDALKIESDDNRYLDAVEPISVSPTTLTENFFPSSVPEFCLQLPNSDVSFNSFQTQDVMDTGDFTYSSSWDGRYYSTKNSLHSTDKPDRLASFPEQNSDVQTQAEVFQDLTAANVKICSQNLSFESSFDFSSILQFPTAKQTINEDSFGRPRSKSYSGRPSTFSSTRNFINSRHQTKTLNSNMTLQSDSFDWDFGEVLRDNCDELSLQDIEPWPITQEWQSNGLLSSALHS